MASRISADSASAEQGVVLFIDDDEQSSGALINTLLRRNAPFVCHSATNEQQGLTSAKQHMPHVVVLDLTLDPSIGPESGLAVLGKLIASDPTTRILVLTGHGSEAMGITALRHGAASFLVKPVDPNHLVAVIEDGISYATLKRRLRESNAMSDDLIRRTGLSSSSPAMHKVIEAAAFAGTNLQPVLLVGETGTGKGVIARAIHRCSERHNGPFVRLQPSFGGSDLVSSELFGHEKGAFTGALSPRRGLIEEANEGTLFIDEVDELPTDSQVSLLNVLQEKIFRRLGSNLERSSNFRLIAAMNRSVEETLETKKLRHDFYHRIAHLTIHIPPLRERMDDIPDLAREFVLELAGRENFPVYGLTDQALAVLSHHAWPGNIRELQAVVEGATYRARFFKRHMVEVEDIELAREKRAITVSGSFRERVRAYEIDLVRHALSQNDHNQVRAAQSLQMDRSTLRRILSRDKQTEI